MIDRECKVRNVQQLHAANDVYNIEVDGEHVYRLLDAGVLVHNAKYDHIDWKHILFGGLNKKGRPVGFHHVSGEIAGYGKRVAGTKGPENQFGAYKQEVLITGATQTKTSSFFPDSWGSGKVLQEIDHAFKGAAYTYRW